MSLFGSCVASERAQTSCGFRDEKDDDADAEDVGRAATAHFVELDELRFGIVARPFRDIVGRFRPVDDQHLSWGNSQQVTLISIVGVLVSDMGFSSIRFIQSFNTR